MAGEYCTANGIGVVIADIRMPRVGVWHADLVLDTMDAGPFGEGAKVVLVAGGETFRGTVRRSGVFKGALHLRMVGGAGGLTTPLSAKSYRGVPLRIPLQDILTAAKETLAPTADAASLATVLQKWACVAQAAGEAVAALLPAAGDGLAWRILKDGTFWLGREAWKPRAVEPQMLHEEPALGRVEVDAQPSIVPGDSVGGAHVSYVEHHFGARRLRTKLWLET